MLPEGGLVGIERAYEHFTGLATETEAELLAIRHRLLDENFRGEMSGLVRIASRILAAEGHAASFSPDLLRRAIAAILSAFEVYRTYRNDKGLSPHDQTVLADACRKAASHGDADDLAAIDFIRKLLLGEASHDAKAAVFRTRFQQLSGPLMAKSVEDTLFYRQNRMLALNEVGMAPMAGPLSIESFHARMRERARLQPRALSAGSTHDTKRGEDARARIATLAEDAERWGEAVARWHRMNEGLRAELGGRPVPDPTLEWMIYQALLGIWPETGTPTDSRMLAALRERFGPYLEKVLREAKQHSSWTQPDEAYEKATIAFAEGLLDTENRTFLKDFATAGRPFMRAGYLNSLMEAVVRCGAPGVPDVYQGSEALDFSLVDPDNRRMPDYERLSALLESGPEATFGGDPYASGALKLHVLRRGLLFRKLRPALFENGEYIPLAASGEAREHVVSFARQDEGDLALYVGLHRPLRFEAAQGRGGRWGDTALPLPSAHRNGTTIDSFVNILTGDHIPADKTLAMSQLLAAYPVAILVARAEG